MQLLVNTTSRDGTAPWHIIGVFGIGLIGTPIVSELAKRNGILHSKLPFSWQEPGLQARQSAAIENAIQALIDSLSVTHSAAKGLGNIAIVWSAGKGGFASSDETLAPELESFKQVVTLASRLSRHNPDITIRLHMLSSAGGLFEGVRNVDCTTRPEPHRPYGRLKLSQERYLIDSSTEFEKHIYRPSSVYGFTELGNRMGLIPNLIGNGLQHRISEIYGSMDTLRDYVLADDIGRFIAKQILATTSPPTTSVTTLAAGRPSSIFEIQQIIETTIAGKIYIRFQQLPSNSSHNSFNPSILPEGWLPTTLETGVRLVYERLFRQWIESRNRK